MKRGIAYISLFVIGLIVGIVATLVWFTYYPNGDAHSYLQNWYHAVSIIGSIGTVAAVIVALFKDEIKNSLFHPCITVEKNDDGDGSGLIEVKDQNEGTPKVKCYECCVRISNTGNRPANDCEVKLIGVKYSTSNGKWKDLMKDSKHIDWPYYEDVTTLLTEECKKLPLFRIYPDNSEGTPDKKMKSIKRLQLFGHSMGDKFQKKGDWIFSYKIVSPQKEYCKFNVIVNWSGIWCDRINEMQDEVTVILEQK